MSSSHTAPVIRLRNVSKKYLLDGYEFQAIKELSCDIPKSKMTFLFGPSGSGKTTLLNMLGLIDSPTSGELEILGTSVLSLSDNQKADFRNQHIGFIFQSFNLIPVLSVVENVEFPLIRQIHSAKTRRKTACQFLEAVGLKDFINRQISQISGGQRQRVAIARALVAQPSIIIADEPTANLDSVTSAEIINLMNQMQQEFEISFIICTHNENLIQPASHILRMKDGELQSITQAQGSK